jgi:3-hydroxyacyl-[acyl-carrier-protein] dehydratase
MRFNLIDRIVELDPGKSIRVIKNLTLAEEYLADHFPTFPIMPGVLMLQTLVEAGAWLIRISNDFQQSVVVMREAKFVKYGQMMEPGRQMCVTATVVESSGGVTTLKGRGEAEGKQTVSAQVTLRAYNLAEQNADLEAVDRDLVAYWRGLYRILRGELGSDRPR